jgi:hypothetical protein
MKYKSVFMVGLLLLSAFAAFSVPNASAADKNYLKVDENQGSMVNRYVNFGTAYTLGDKEITFAIAIQNIQYDWVSNPLNYWIQNISAKVTSQRDMTGAQFNILDFSNGENTIKTTAGYNLTAGTLMLSGYQADIVATAPAGNYNLTVEFTYDYCVADINMVQHWTTKATDRDYFYIKVDDGLHTIFLVDAKNSIRVGWFDEIHTTPMSFTLFAGTKFQKVGVHIAEFNSATGKIGEVTATIKLSTQTSSFLTLDQLTAYTSQLDGDIYFKYRVDVKDGTPPGKYDATMEVKYLRHYGNINTKPNQIQITAQSIPVEFVVAFTPLLTITSPASFTVTQGSLATNLTEVTLQNIGNTELKKIKVWIDISHYFEENGYYFDADPNMYGAKVLLPTQDQKEKLGKGETWQVDFMGINVFKYLPEGEHRLPLSYSGYYYDDGTATGSSDYLLTDASLYLAIKGVPLYLKVIVPANTHDYKVLSTSSVNLGTKMKDISLSFSVENLEAVHVLYTSIQVGTKDQTSNKVLLVNPKNTGSNYLEPIEMTQFNAYATMYFSVNADVAFGATAGYYTLPVLITGTDYNTKVPTTTTVSMSVRVNPVPPKLVVTSLSFIDKDIVPGKDFPLTINVMNVGNDTARQVYVTFVEGSNGGGVVETTYAPDVVRVDAAINPFSVKVSRILVDTSIAPGETKAVTYTVHADKNLVKGKDYQMYVYVDYTDDLARSWSYSSEVTVSVTGKIPTKPQDNSGMMNTAFGAVLLLIFVIILMIIWVKVITKPKRPSRFEEALPEEPTPRSGSPPSSMGAPATAAPAATPTHTVVTAAGAQTFKVCPACHKSVPASQVTCPHCGCAL